MSVDGGAHVFKLKAALTGDTMQVQMLGNGEFLGSECSADLPLVKHLLGSSTPHLSACLLLLVFLPPVR